MRKLLIYSSSTAEKMPAMNMPMPIMTFTYSAPRMESTPGSNTRADMT